MVVVRGAEGDYPTGIPNPRICCWSSKSPTVRFDAIKVSKGDLREGGHFGLKIVNRRLHVEAYSDTTGAVEEHDYRFRRDFGEADQVPVVIEGREVAKIPVRDVLA